MADMSRASAMPYMSLSPLASTFFGVSVLKF